MQLPLPDERSLLNDEEVVLIQMVLIDEMLLLYDEVGVFIPLWTDRMDTDEISILYDETLPILHEMYFLLMIH